VTLTRFWFEFEGEIHPYGVTAYSRTDALEILRSEAFRSELPPIQREIADVDVSQLDPDHVLPNIWPPTWRGIWYPVGYQRNIAKPS
jgi:hypothetical protein